MFVVSDGVDEYAVNKFLCQVFADDCNSHGKVCSLVKEAASRKFDMKEEVLSSTLLYELSEFRSNIYHKRERIPIYIPKIYGSLKICVNIWHRLVSLTISEILFSCHFLKLC